MLKWVYLVLFLIVVDFTVGTYLFFKGFSAGEIAYRKSIKMQMALDSAYNFGLADGQRSCTNRR